MQRGGGNLERVVGGSPVLWGMRSSCEKKKIDQKCEKEAHCRIAKRTRTNPGIEARADQGEPRRKRAGQAANHADQPGRKIRAADLPGRRTAANCADSKHERRQQYEVANFYRAAF